MLSRTISFGPSRHLTGMSRSKVGRGARRGARGLKDQVVDPSLPPSLLPRSLLPSLPPSLPSSLPPSPPSSIFLSSKRRSTHTPSLHHNLPFSGADGKGRGNHSRSLTISNSPLTSSRELASQRSHVNVFKAGRRIKRDGSSLASGKRSKGLAIEMTKVGVRAEGVGGRSSRNKGSKATKLKKGFQQHVDPKTGKVYYFNARTGVSTWTKLVAEDREEKENDDDSDEEEDVIVVQDEEEVFSGRNPMHSNMSR